MLNLLVEKFKNDIASDDRHMASLLDEGARPDEDDEDDQELDSDAKEAVLDALEDMKERILKGESLLDHLN